MTKKITDDLEKIRVLNGNVKFDVFSEYSAKPTNDATSGNETGAVNTATAPSAQPASGAFTPTSKAVSSVLVVPKSSAAILDNSDEFEIKFDCAKDERPGKSTWIWKYVLVDSAVHIVAGPQGCGKTTIVISMLATVTIGGAFPGQPSCEKAAVLRACFKII
jgi:RecA-family ATPase